MERKKFKPRRNPSRVPRELRSKPLFVLPTWLRELATPVRRDFNAPTQEIIDFFSGWALHEAGANLNLNGRLEILGRSRMFRRVQLVRIDFNNLLVQPSDLRAFDFLTMRRLLAGKTIQWQSLVADPTQAMFGYDCILAINYPQSTEDLERARAAYDRELAITKSLS
jgi:hypothetical protein